MLKWLGKGRMKFDAYDIAVINIEFWKTPVEVYRVDEDDRESRRRKIEYIGVHKGSLFHHE